MADLRIVDAPEIPTNSITGEEKLPTGGNGNYSISLDSLADYTKTKKNLADNTSVDTKVSGVRQQLNAHTQNLSNPHQVTKGQIGLGNVDNTADADKPVSNSTQAAIISAVAPKADKTYVDNVLSNKSDKAYVDSQLSLKANKVDVYTKAETYTKQESSDLVSNTIATALNPVNTSLDLAKRGIINRYDSSLTYNSGERVILTNGDIVKSNIDGNVNDPNVDMSRWVLESSKSVSNPSDLATLQNPKNKQRVYVESIQKTFIYDVNLAIPENGVTVIGNWEMNIQDAYYASWFATPNVMVDQSEKLQKGWNYATSKNRKFIFDNVYYVALNERTYSDSLKRKIGLQVPDNSYTEFLEKAAIKVIPNAEPLGYVLNFYLAENFKIYDPVVFGDVDEHLATTDESNHCFNIVNCKNGYIHKPKAYNAWGDGIYIGTEYASASLKQLENVTVFEPQAEHCGRDCISITAGKNLTIYSPFVKDAFRTSPKAGINIESEGVGVTKSEFINVKIVGSIRAENCDFGLSIQLFDSLHNDVSISIDDVYAKECKASVFTQLFASNSGSVKIGNIYAESWGSAALRCNWSQLNCQLNIRDIHSINANCNGTIERISSVVSMDVDSESQPLLNLGNVTIGNIHILDISTTKVMHPLYFKDNTSASDGARKLDKIRIGNVYGTTLNTAYYVDGHVTSNFKFNLEYVSAYYLPPSRPYLYSKLKSVAVGFDPFTLTVNNSYKTELTVQKYASSDTPLRLILPSGSTISPPSLGANSGLESTISGSSISIEWNGNNAFITSKIGTWNSY